jgi:hypothetical protein
MAGCGSKRKMKEGGKVKKANENPNKKLEEQGNTTKSNMGGRQN